jgi:hypothetical protein
VFGSGIRPHFGFAGLQQPAILRAEFELPHRPAFAAIDQKRATSSSAGAPIYRG